MDTLAPDIPRVDVEAYRAQGFVLVPRVFDAKAIARMRAEADAMLERVVAAGNDVAATWKGSWRERLIRKWGNGDTASSDQLVQMPAAISSIHNVQYHSAYFMRVIMDERLTGVIAQLIGGSQRALPFLTRAFIG